MAPVKRKAVTDERPSKKVRATEEQPEGKSGAKPSKPRKSQDADAGERKPPAKSVLQSEERSFPRGGASVLTPIEQKQIRAQAERDVLFEQQTGQPATNEEGEEDLFDTGKADGTAKKGKKSRQQSDKESGGKEGSGIRIQGLSYKTLVTGAIVLGRVTGITGKDVALALPNNITGYAPITSISGMLNGRIEKMLQEDSKEEEEDDNDIELKAIFHIGQWLRATVTATTSEGSENKTKRHIELSLDPSIVNAGLDKDSVVSNSMLQASVKSVEDHGIVMDLGLQDANVKGFISKKDLGAGYKLDKIQEGQVMLCLVTGKGSDGKVMKLSPDAARFSAIVGGKQAPVVTEAPTVDAFLPGTAVDVLITEVPSAGVAGKLMGMVDVTADFVHAGGASVDDLSAKYKVGSKSKARIIWSLPTDEGSRKVGVSFLDTLVTLSPSPDMLPENASAKQKAQASSLQQHQPSSSIINDAAVTQVLADRGVFLALPTISGTSSTAFAHISQLSDSRTDTVSSSTGPFKLASTHKARVLAFNPVDNIYYVTLKQSVIDQPFLRLEDLAVGEVVKGTVDRLILGGTKGITGVLVKLAEGISALVPEMHLSDAQLQHPERKFREGFPVTGRVLSVDTDKRHARVTLKKSIVNDENLIWKSYEDLKPGMESKGTIVKLARNGGVVQFFGNVRAWLPVAEMSDAFIESAEKHFRVGQTVNARILSVEAASNEMKVSCKAGVDNDDESTAAWELVQPGQLVSATVTEKTAESVSLDLENGARGVLRLNHLKDGSAAKAEAELKRLRVGQKLSNLLVVNKLDRSRQILLSNKEAMVGDAKAGVLLKSLGDLKPGQKAHGFVRNITADGIYVEFVNGLVGLALKTQISPEMAGQPAFGLRKDQSVSPWILNVDAARQRFTLTFREPKEDAAAPAAAAAKQTNALPLVKPVDESLSTTADLAPGKITKARIASVKGTQLNVRLADGVHGRIDVSEAFDSWEQITNKRNPLQQFKPNETIDVKVLGIHDARNHRFLPISHRGAGNTVLELSAKPSRLQEGNSQSLNGLDDLSVGWEGVAFINNWADEGVWVSLSPNVRGRVALMDLSEDVGLLQDVPKNFPVGCALRVRVKNVMPLSNRLDLTAKLGAADESNDLTLESLALGSVLPGRVTKVSERAVTVQLSDSLAAPVSLAELSDDFDQADPFRWSKNDIVRVSVLSIDKANKRFSLSLRPSKVLSSGLPVEDPQILSLSAVKVGDVRRGFVKHVGEKGVLVSLSGTVDAFVRVADLSDQYIKDWKSHLQIDQLVRGRVISVDSAAKHIQLSLKASHADENYKPPMKLEDLEKGMIVTGKVRKVEDFGAFIDLHDTQPRLSGLAHRSEIAAKRIEDVRKLYSAGDVVKAKVLSVDVNARKISLGLKASYFKGDADVEDEDVDDEMNDAEASEGEASDLDEDDEEGGINLDDVEDMDSEDGDDAVDADGMDVDDEEPAAPTSGLATTGFDWTGNSLNTSAANGYVSDSEPDTTTKKRKRTKAEIKVDFTGELDKNGPQSTSDFERQLLGQPNSSSLWIQYMAFHLQLSEVQKARDTAARALRTIHIREADEKKDVWTALLNLEVEYGDEEKVEDVFKRACEVQDSLEMHEKLASIYIDSGKYDKADKVFERMVGNKSFRASPDVWLNYATFLMNNLSATDRARALLSRGMKSVPTREHRLLTAKFAALEFRSSAGDPERGRTIFEGLVSEYPKWSSGWDMWLDIERGRLASADSEEAKTEGKEQVRRLFERIVGGKMKKRRARFIFKRWLEFEEQEGDGKASERVKALAKEWVDKAQASGGDEGDDE